MVDADEQELVVGAVEGTPGAGDAGGDAGGAGGGSDAPGSQKERLRRKMELKRQIRVKVAGLKSKRYVRVQGERGATRAAAATPRTCARDTHTRARTHHMHTGRS